MEIKNVKDDVLDNTMGTNEGRGLAYKITNLLKLFGLRGLQDRVTKIYICDLKKNTNFLSSFNQITGLNLDSVNSAVSEFKTMLDKARITYVCGRSTKSTYMQLADTPNDMRCLLEERQIIGSQGRSLLRDKYEPAYFRSDELLRTVNNNKPDEGGALLCDKYESIGDRLLQTDAKTDEGMIDNTTCIVRVECGGTVNKHIVKTGEAVGHFKILKAYLVLTVEVYADNSLVNTLDYKFVDLSEPLPLFKSLQPHDGNCDLLWPVLERQALVIKIKTNGNFTEVPYTFNVYKLQTPINQLPIIKTLEWDVLVNNYLTIKRVGNKHLTSYNLSLWGPTTRLVVRFQKQPERDLFIKNVILRLWITDENNSVEFTFTRSSEGSNVWTHQFPLSDKYKYAYQLPNLSVIKADIDVNGQGYEGFYVAQESVNKLIFSSGMSILAYTH